jgi:hypothetical protein
MVTGSFALTFLPTTANLTIWLQKINFFRRIREEGLLHEEHKRWRIVVNGGLLLSRKERAMIITLSEQIILTANQPRSGTHHFSARASVQTSDSVDAVEGRFVPEQTL